MSVQAIREWFNEAVYRICDRVDERLGVRERAGRFADAFVGTPERKSRSKTIGAVAAAMLLIGGGVGLYFALRPYPEPDYRTARIDELFNFTLLKDEFNRLSIERRLELLGILRERMEGMSGSESMLLAAFAAGIMGQARQQIEENMSRLAIDLWDSYATQYEAVLADDRDAFLDATYVDFYKQMAILGGDTVDESDEEILREGKEEAQRGHEWLKTDGPGGRMLGRGFDIMYNNVGQNATPQQKARGTLLVRDMTRRFRGQDVATGRPMR